MLLLHFTYWQSFGVEGLELFLGQRYGVGQQFLKKPHAFAEAVCPVLALLLFLLLDQPLILLALGEDSTEVRYFASNVWHILSKFLIVQSIAALGAPGIRGVIGVNGLLSQHGGNLLQGALLLASQEQHTGTIADNGFRMVFVDCI